MVFHEKHRKIERHQLTRHYECPQSSRYLLENASLPGSTGQSHLLSIIQLEDLEPYPAGIRAQAVLKDGTLVHDFLFAESARSLHVCNAPSPAATSAIPIGGYICDKIAEKQQLPTSMKIADVA
ncbi:hypothetical protein AK966_11510 [Vibrio sp. PID23_8]|nr:hypothetical protein AK966_11510 [Vibrio sp. PID23_8]